MTFKLPVVLALACVASIACIPPPEPPSSPCVVYAEAGATSVDLDPLCKTGIPGLSTGSPAALQLNSSDGGDLRVVDGALPSGTSLGSSGALTGEASSPGLWAATLRSSNGARHRVWGWVSEPDPNWDDSGFTLLDPPPTDMFLVAEGNLGRLGADGTLRASERVELSPVGPTAAIDAGMTRRSLDSGIIVLPDPRTSPASTCDLSVLDLTKPSMPLLVKIPLPTNPSILQCEVGVSADKSTVIVRRTGDECYRRGAEFIDVQFFDVEELRHKNVDPDTVAIGSCTGASRTGAISDDGKTYVHNFVFERFGPICEVWKVDRSGPPVEKSDCLRDNGDGTLTTLRPLLMLEPFADLAPSGLLATQTELIQWVQPPGDEGHVVRISNGIGWVEPSDGSVLEVVDDLPLEVFPLFSNSGGFVSAVDTSTGIGSVFDLGNGGAMTDLVSANGSVVILLPAS